MHHTAIALYAYVSWTLLMLVLLGGLRVYNVMAKGKPANSFSPQGDDVSAYSARLCRVHANCYESFPVFGGLLILSLLTDLTQITDGLALVAVAARVGQSLVHLVSTSVMAVNVRFAFFLAQLVIWVYWAVALGQALLA